MAVFSSLSERLTEALSSLRTKGKLSASDVDGTVREIRRALLEADVALDVLREAGEQPWIIGSIASADASAERVVLNNLKTH